MRYKKLFLILLIFLLTGCSNNYSYDINTVNYFLDVNKTFNEKIVFTFDNDIYNKVEREKNDEDITYESLEYSLLNEKIEPIYSYHDIFYNKRIMKNGDKVNIELNYKYLEDEYRYSQNILQCFENYDLNSEEDFFEINLGGNFYCYNGLKYKITLNTNYEVLDSNVASNNGKYVWEIDGNNYKDTDISIVISRKYSDMDAVHFNVTSIKDAVLDIIKVVLIILLFVLIVYLKKKEKRL